MAGKWHFWLQCLFCVSLHEYTAPDFAYVRLKWRSSSRCIQSLKKTFPLSPRGCGGWGNKWGGIMASVHAYVHIWVYACKIICVHMCVRYSLFIWMGIHWAAISKLNAFALADCFTSLSCCCEWDAAFDGYKGWQESPLHTHKHTQHFIHFHPHSFHHTITELHSLTSCLLVPSYNVYLCFWRSFQYTSYYQVYRRCH